MPENPIGFWIVLLLLLKSGFWILDSAADRKPGLDLVGECGLVIFSGGGASGESLGAGASAGTAASGGAALAFFFLRFFSEGGAMPALGKRCSIAARCRTRC
jgi:hypothetical protein